MSRRGRSAEERLVTLVHDLRTPLTVVTGFCELIERRGPDLTEAQRTEYLGRIAAAAAELRDILDREREERLSDGEPG